MSSVRSPAVAGMFYPGEARELATTVQRLLADAALRARPAPLPKAIIAPHAGYIYSGAVAASAYVRLRPLADRVRRIVLIGPCHRVAVRGLALPDAEAFATPLGTVPLDRTAIADLLTLPQVHLQDAAHAPEHALEVHLPFLQEIFSTFTLVPIVVGNATGAQVAELLERLWGGDETLIVISSDLSHYLPYDEARALDAATCAAIESLDAAAIGEDQACGRVPVLGLIEIARRRGLRVETLDLRNSGDTAGDRRRVVGYGAWALSANDRHAGCDPSTAGEDISSPMGRGDELLASFGETLLRLAAASIRHGIATGAPQPVNAAEHAEPLRRAAATFVTLYSEGELRGCVGSARAYRSVVEDVAGNAFAAAFRDSRFTPVGADELEALHLSVSLLTEPEPMRFTDEANLRAQLRPGIDGLILESRGTRGLFLPQVWATLPDPGQFLAHLKRKAGWRADDWPADMTAARFEAHSLSSSTLADPASLWR